MAKSAKKNSEDLIGTHIRLTKKQYITAIRSATKQKISLAEFIRRLIDNA